MMPGLDGLEVCRRLEERSHAPVHAGHPRHRQGRLRDVVAGLDAGADEYLTKPVDQAALVARVKSMLRIKALHDTVGGAGGGARRVEPDAREPRP